MPWIVAVTKPNSESIAIQNLNRQGYDCYAPKFLYRKANKKPVIRYLFPRYLFIRIEERWYSIMGTRGVSRVLMADNGPQPISSGIIDNLKLREEKGLVSLAPRDKFAKGTSVKTESGPFAGYPMVYDGMTSHERVKVLVEMLGQKVTVELEERLLVAA